MPSARVASNAELAAQVTAALAGFLDVRTTELAALSPALSPLSEQLRPLLAQGKRLRPAFVFAGHLAGGGMHSDELTKAAASLEFVQISALIHDDLIDASDSRRGMPSAHRAFESIHRTAGWQGSAERFGNGAAVLLGDLCLCWADQMLFESGMPIDALLRAKAFYDVMRTEVTAGQYLDLMEQHRGDPSLTEVLTVLKLKTAKYTIERPLHMGAALADASDQTLAALTAYGLPLGIAFQLRDDLLGVFGDPAVTGKPAGDDIREGKRTALVTIALQRSSTADAERLRAILGDRTAMPVEIDWCRDHFRQTGAVAEVESMIAASLEEALAALASPAIAGAARDLLSELATAATHRTK